MITDQLTITQTFLSFAITGAHQMIFTLNIISLSLYIRIKHYFEHTFQSLPRLGVKN